MAHPSGLNAAILVSVVLSGLSLGWVIVNRQTTRYVRNPYLERLGSRQSEVGSELREARSRIGWVQSVVAPHGESGSRMTRRVEELEALASAGFRAPWGISLPKEAPKEEVARSVHLYRSIALDVRNSLRTRADAFYLLRWMPNWARTHAELDAASSLLQSLPHDQHSAPIQLRLLGAIRRTRPRYDPLLPVFVDYAMSSPNERVRISAVKGLAAFHEHAVAQAVLAQLLQYDPSKRVRALAARARNGKGYR